tara:strand:- start:164 stop:574 length:411 start_codon:yes stop_codon:yes gene_type:complete
MSNKQDSTNKKREPRRTQYHAAVVDALIESLSEGLTITASCGLVGIDRTTFYKWKQNYPEFKKAVDGARPIIEANMLQKIKDQAQTDWRAAAWILERRFPEDFSLKREVDLHVNKSNGTNEVIEFIKQSEELDDEN